MKKTTIRKCTPRNFKKVADYIAQEKNYSYSAAEHIALQLFETLENNPGGDIWNYADKIIVNEIDTARRNANKLLTDITRIKYFTDDYTERKRLTAEDRAILENYKKAFAACVEILRGATNEII